MVVLTFSAHAERIDVFSINAGNVDLLSKEEDTEKVITNVKVSYNPIAEQIAVSFKIAKQSNVVVKLMDALGNEILNLSNSILDAGSHNLSFETEGKVSPGFYFIRVSSGTEIIVKRISIR